MRIKNINITNPVVIAPLAGYSNIAYREIMKEMGAGLVYTEMVSAKGILYENEQTQQLTTITEMEKPVSLQLFGGEPRDYIEAAKWIDHHTHADIIDVNMGCPVRKVLKADAGSKLLTDEHRAVAIVEALVATTNKPVTVKIRAGWDHQSINADRFARKMEEAGASAIAIHGRTKTDLYGGVVNLDWIKSVKEAVAIPVIGNGDIRSIEDAKRMIEYTGVDAIMIGRGGLGNPWLIRNLVCYFEGRDIPDAPTKQEKMAMAKKHFLRLLTIKPEKVALVEMRSMASWYSKGLKNSKEWKQKIVKAATKEEMIALIDQYSFDDLQ